MPTLDFQQIRTEFAPHSALHFLNVNVQAFHLHMEDAMSEQEFEDALRDVIEERFYEVDDDQRPSQRAFVTTFEEAGVLTRNRGLVVTLADGSSFQLTIVERSK